MSLSAVFADSFLDGFTMAGFLNRLRRPGQAVRMFAVSEPKPLSTAAAKKPDSVDNLIDGWIQETYGIRTVPEVELNAMLVVLKRKVEERNLAALAREGESRGATR